MKSEGLKTNWRDKAKHMLRHRPATLPLRRIAKDTGIPEGWLSRLAQGCIDGPDVNRIETIIGYFEEKQKEAAI